MPETEFCIVCLTTHKKLFLLKEYSLGNIYSDLTKIPVTNWNRHLCVECAYMLKKYQEFKLKCIRTDDILSKSISLTGLTKTVLERMQERFNVGPSLSYSEIITEDLVEIDPHTSVENIGDVQNCFNLDSNDNGVFILLNKGKNEDVINESKSKITLEHNNSTNCTITYLNPTVILERLHTKTLQNLTKPNGDHNLFDDNLFGDVDNDSDDEYLPNLKNTCSTINNISSLKEREGTNILSKRDSNVPVDDDKKHINFIQEEETNNDSLHSDSSWTDINNSLDGINTENKNNSNEIERENNYFLNKFLQNRNLSNNQTNKDKMTNVNKVYKKSYYTKMITKPIDHIKEAIELFTKNIPTKKEPLKGNYIREGIYRGFTPSSVKLIEDLRKQGHTVQILTKEQALQEVLDRASSDNYIKSPYKCDICYRGYLREATFANHMVKHSETKGPFKCVYCHFRYPKKQDLTDHIKIRHKLQFKCNKCPYISDSLYDARRHLRFHEGETFQCKYCDQSFNFSNSLSMHIHIKHQNEFETQYICEFCGSSFHTKNGRNNHVRQTHYDEKNEHQGPKCEKCDIHFASQEAYDRHLVVSYKHEGRNTDYKWPPNSSSKWKIRENTDSKESQIFTCDICRFKSCSEAYYKLHLHKKHGHPKPPPKSKLPKEYLICDICGRNFRHSFGLTNHMRKHTGECPFECQYCGKRYATKLSLSVHENKHTRAKLYKCEICVDKEFYLPSSYSKHMQTHVGFKPHKCLLCDRGFINKSRMQHHVKHFHQKIPYPPRKNPRAKKPKMKKRLILGSDTE